MTLPTFVLYCLTYSYTQTIMPITEQYQVLYEVYTTNADLEHLVLVHQGFDRDLAETVMVKKFRESEYKGDFMLYDHSSQEALCLLFSERTKRLRSECS